VLKELEAREGSTGQAFRVLPKPHR
jgi:hypothetical protein